MRIAVTLMLEANRVQALTMLLALGGGLNEASNLHRMKEYVSTRGQ